MFNAYIAEQRQQKARKIAQVVKKENSIKKRYHTEIQPLLLEHYQKRIRNFIEKMNTNPIIINPQNLLPPIKEEPHFTFKNSSNWKILGNVSHKSESLFRGRNGNKQQNERQKYLNVDNDVYCVYKHQFRSREREKQLQPAMRFRSVEKLREFTKTKHISALINKKKQRKQRTENTNGLRETSNSNSSAKILDESLIDFLVNRQKFDIEVEARRYEKQRQPDQKKLHFKKIADLAINQKNEFYKKDLKQILLKTGFCKRKRRNFTEAPQTDNFLTMVQKVENR